MSTSEEEIDWAAAADDTIVCYCAHVDKGRIVAAIRAGAQDGRAIHAATGAGFGGRCMELNPRKRCCHSDIEQLINLYGKNE
jgi:NAD(P)H-nitrite reductase large subunit